MARKRVRGNFRKLPSGRWQVRYTGPDGLRYTMANTYPTKADADAAFGIVAGEMAQGRWSDPDLVRVTVTAFARRWIAERAGLGERTRELYSSLLRLHIAPTIGRVELRHVTPATVREWRQGLLDKGVGESTVAKAYRLLRSVLMTAMDDGLLHRNPARIRGAATENPAERPVLTPGEVAALADAIDGRYRLLVLLGVYASLRWGELMGLTRADIDVKTMTVHVRRSVAEVNGRLVIKAPKTAAGARSVAIPSALHEEIERHLDMYAEPGRLGRVFLGHRGGTLHRSNFTGPWRKAKAAAGVRADLHFHDLRHTGNHFAAGTGASTRDLMTRMGHASARAALIYQHASASRDRTIAQSLELHVVPRGGVT